MPSPPLLPATDRNPELCDLFQISSRITNSSNHVSLVGTRSTSAISLCAIEAVCPSSQSMVTSLQDAPTTVPRSVVVAPQQTRSPPLRCLDCSPVIGSICCPQTPHRKFDSSVW